MSMGASAYGGPRQLAFDFVRTSPAQAKQVSDNLYFAVLPDPDAARRMAEVGRELRDRHRLPGRVQPPRLLHISLAHVGNYADLPAHVVAAARSAGSAVRNMPFEVCFDRAISFDNPRGFPLVMRCSQGDAGFERLRVATTTAMIRSGIRPGRAISLAACDVDLQGPACSRNSARPIDHLDRARTRPCAQPCRSRPPHPSRPLAALRVELSWYGEGR